MVEYLQICITTSLVYHCSSVSLRISLACTELLR